jgi:hypothetical protein
MTDSLVWLSSLGLLLVGVYQAVRDHRWREWLVWLLGLAALMALFLRSRIVLPPFSARPAARGDDGALLIVVLYLVMLVGMFSHYLYSFLRRPRARRRRFDLAAFVAPVFVSPIVFLPLASVLRSLEAGNPANADASRLLLFLVAYENGFFWREFFENRRETRNEAA